MRDPTLPGTEGRPSPLPVTHPFLSFPSPHPHPYPSPPPPPPLPLHPYFFYYVRSSNRFLSPTHFERLVSPSASLCFSPTHEPKSNSNCSDDVVSDYDGGATNIMNGFEGTPSFSALLLQPVSRGGEPLERSGGEIPFSAPPGGFYMRKKQKKGILGFRTVFHRNVSSEKKRSWVVSVLNFIRKKEVSAREAKASLEAKIESNVQWAVGKVGEDHVHLVVFEVQGWLFVRIYDGFNVPDVSDFLMGHFYHVVYNEFQGLFWDTEQAEKSNPLNLSVVAESAVLGEVKNNKGDVDVGEVPCRHEEGEEIESIKN